MEVPIFRQFNNLSIMRSSDDDEDTSPVQRISAIVDKFLLEQSRKFKRGTAGLMSDQLLRSITRKLGTKWNTVTVDSIPYEYKLFWNTYGSVYGGPYSILGPGSGFDAGANALIVQEMSMAQNQFKHFLYNTYVRKGSMSKKQVKAIWLLAEVYPLMLDEYGYSFYMDMSKDGRIYCVQFPHPHYLFAKDFIDFLEKFFLFVVDKEEYVTELYDSDSGVE